MPTPAAIRMVGDAFKNAPVSNPDGGAGISLHVDAGDSYPTGSEAEAYLIRGAGNQLLHRYELDEAITTPAGCQRDPLVDPVWKCQFDLHPGTVGWKTGFRYIKDEILSGPPVPTDPNAEDPCDLPGNTCVRRFDANRIDMFHYAFFAHAVGMPKSLNACLDVTDPSNPVEAPDDNGRCVKPLEENPLFFTPRTNSGIGDFPGRDVLITLGAFSNRFGKPGGTDFMVASTFFHELGHNFELRHGAREGIQGRVLSAPNCIPTYLSSMNYLYQLRGLLDDAGTPHLDFSRAAGVTERDGRPGSTRLSGFTPRDRIGWYAPLEGSYLVDANGLPRTTVAGRHCDGSPLGREDQAMVRVDAWTAAGVIDWNANGVEDGYSNQDLNFDGWTEKLPPAYNDWANIRLNQIRRRAGTSARRSSTRTCASPLVRCRPIWRAPIGPAPTGRAPTGRAPIGHAPIGHAPTGGIEPRRPGPLRLCPGGLGTCRLGARRLGACGLGPRRLGPGRRGPRRVRRRRPVHQRPAQRGRRAGLRNRDAAGEHAAVRVHGVPDWG